jgi:hypothetical protein
LIAAESFPGARKGLKELPPIATPPSKAEAWMNSRRVTIDTPTKIEDRRTEF